MGAGCSKEPKVKENNRQIMNLQIQIKLKKSELESKIKKKDKETQKYLEEAKQNLKNGNKAAAKRAIKNLPLKDKVKKNNNNVRFQESKKEKKRPSSPGIDIFTNADKRKIKIDKIPKKDNRDE